jgi:hypothetical protein
VAARYAAASAAFTRSKRLRPFREILGRAGAREALNKLPYVTKSGIGPYLLELFGAKAGGRDCGTDGPDARAIAEIGTPYRTSYDEAPPLWILPTITGVPISVARFGDFVGWRLCFFMDFVIMKWRG